MKTLLTMSLAGSAAILVVLGMRFLLRKAPKIFSYGLWAVVLFRLLCPVGIPVKLPESPQPAPVQRETVTQNAEVRTVRHQKTEPAPMEKPTGENSPVAPAEPVKPSLSTKQIVTGIWILGASLTFLVGLSQYLRFRRNLAGACRVEGNLYQADHIGSAFAVGVFRPKIYIPSNLSPSEIPYILAHERHHIRRGDPIVRHLAFGALCLHWFNPLVWVAFVLSGKDMEMSCDEAVIRKFGESVRADYASSLLNLAMGKSILSGAPIAFGEGNTKKRIQNLIAWKPQKRSAKFLCLSTCLCAVLLCACQPAPEKPVVVSKNDGEFQKRMTLPATEEAGSAPMKVSKHDTFKSTDGSMEFTWNIEKELPSDPMPVVEVSPHVLTAEEGEQILKGIVGEVPFYELEDEDKRVYSKEELQYMLQLITPYASREGYAAIYSAKLDRVTDEDVEMITSIVDHMTRELEQAPEENPHKLCDWKFKKASAYYLGDDNDTNMVLARTKYEDLWYTASVVSCDRKDLKLNYVNLNLGIQFEKGVLLKEHSQDYKPTQEQIDAVTKKAQAILNQLPNGPWVMQAPTIRENVNNDDSMDYIIELVAVPSFNGVTALSCQDSMSNHGSDTAEAVYLPSEVSFSYFPDGVLLDFRMDSPVDIKADVNSAVQTLSIEELMAQVEKNLSLNDVLGSDYGDAMVGSTVENVAKVLLIGKVEITDLEFGLARSAVKDEKFSYYYAPALVVKGTADYYGKESGERYTGTGDRFGPREVILMIINAVDGSVIQ